VFRDNATGEYTLSIRGTESVVKDIIIADLYGIAAQGFERGQSLSLFRYYKKLTTIEGQTVTYSTEELLMMKSLMTGVFDPFVSLDDVIAEVANDTGLGIILAAAQINVAGHSLGGHLAMVFSTMFPDSIKHVYKRGQIKTGSGLTY